MEDKEVTQPEAEHPPTDSTVDNSKKNNAPGAIEDALKDFRDSSGLYDEKGSQPTDKKEK